MDDRTTRANTAKIVIGCYMVRYYTLNTNKKSFLVGTKTEVKSRLKTHGGLVNDVFITKWDGRSWNVVLDNNAAIPINTLFTANELVCINIRNDHYDHLEDLFGGDVCPLPKTPEVVAAISEDDDVSLLPVSLSVASPPQGITSGTECERMKMVKESQLAGFEHYPPPEVGQGRKMEDFNASDFIEFITEVKKYGQWQSYWKAKKLSTIELKELWDSYDGIETKNSEIDGESVHIHLNLRGCGAYCAV